MTFLFFRVAPTRFNRSFLSQITVEVAHSYQEAVRLKGAMVVRSMTLEKLRAHSLKICITFLHTIKYSNLYSPLKVYNVINAVICFFLYIAGSRNIIVSL